MTLDDLDKIFEEAATPKSFIGQVDYRKGVAAVVLALRDEFTKLGALEFQDGWSVLKKFDDILGSDAGEKVVGGSTREDEQAPQGVVSTPTTDPAPDVCVWVPDVQFRDAFTTECGYMAIKRPAGSPCICAKPIKFTEAK